MDFVQSQLLVKKTNLKLARIRMNQFCQLLTSEYSGWGWLQLQMQVLFDIQLMHNQKLVSYLSEPVKAVRSNSLPKKLNDIAPWSFYQDNYEPKERSRAMPSNQTLEQPRKMHPEMDISKELVVNRKHPRRSVSNTIDTSIFMKPEKQKLKAIAKPKILELLHDYLGEKSEDSQERFNQKLVLPDIDRRFNQRLLPLEYSRLDQLQISSVFKQPVNRPNLVDLTSRRQSNVRRYSRLRMMFEKNNLSERCIVNPEEIELAGQKKSISVKKRR